jgi:hypothetical protein
MSSTIDYNTLNGFLNELKSCINTGESNTGILFKISGGERVLSVKNIPHTISDESNEHFDYLRNKKDLKTIKKYCDYFNETLIKNGDNYRFVYILKDLFYQAAFYKCDNVDEFSNFMSTYFIKVKNLRKETFEINKSVFDEIKANSDDSKRSFLKFERKFFSEIEVNLEYDETNSQISEISFENIQTTPNSWAGKVASGLTDTIQEKKFSEELMKKITKNQNVKKQKSLEITKITENDEIGKYQDQLLSEILEHQNDNTPEFLSLCCKKEISGYYFPIEYKDGKFSFKISESIKKQEMISTLKKIYDVEELSEEIMEKISKIDELLCPIDNTEYSNDMFHELRVCRNKNGKETLENCFNNRGRFFFTNPENSSFRYFDECVFI